MVGASRFIGQKGMTAQRYDSDPGNGGETEAHLRKKGWFRQLKENELLYARVRSIAQSLHPQGKVSTLARFYVLNPAYDTQ